MDDNDSGKKGRESSSSTNETSQWTARDPDLREQIDNMQTSQPKKRR